MVAVARRVKGGVMIVFSGSSNALVLFVVYILDLVVVLGSVSRVEDDELSSSCSVAAACTPRRRLDLSRMEGVGEDFGLRRTFDRGRAPVEWAGRGGRETASAVKAVVVVAVAIARAREAPTRPNADSFARFSAILLALSASYELFSWPVVDILKLLFDRWSCCTFVRV